MLITKYKKRSVTEKNLFRMIPITRLVCLVFLETLILVFSIFACLLCLSPANAASVTLAWDANSEPDVAGYRIYYGKALGNYESVIDVGNQKTCIISDLEDGQTYYFAVTAYDLLGRESDFSSELRYPDPFSLTTPLSTGLNLVSLPLEPLNPSISALTEQLSPCLLQAFAYTKDAEGFDTWLYYDPTLPDQSTLTTMEPGNGYWVEMTCPAEMTVVGNRTTNPITLIPGLNLVGYNSLTPLPVSEGLASIANKYAFVWGYKDDQWTFYDPSDVALSTFQLLTPGGGYWIEATEETTWTLPSVMTIPLSSGLNLISLPLEPLNPSISALTEQLSPCLLNISAYVNDTYAWEFYDPAQLDQSTLSTMEPGKGYWIEMACPAEMTVVGNRTTNPVALTPGLNLVGYNSLTPRPISAALSSLAGQYSMVWAYENDEWLFYDPNDEAGSTLQVLTPGSGYWIEATEETAWTLLPWVKTKSLTVSLTIPLSSGLNLISLPLEPLNPSISALTEQLSPCLVNVFAYVSDTYAWEYYDPTQVDQSTLSTVEPGKGYWIEMACPAEMTVVGNRTTNPITLIPGLNLVGYNSLTPLPVSQGLASIANQYTFVWGYKDDQWVYYDPADAAGSTLQVLTPGSGYWIEAIEETIWTSP